jgi:hypothetical protein
MANPSVHALAEENLDEDECEYCGRTDEAVGADTDVLMTRILESFRTVVYSTGVASFREVPEEGAVGEPVRVSVRPMAAHRTLADTVHPIQDCDDRTRRVF